MATISPKNEGTQKLDTGAIGVFFGYLLCISGLVTAVLGVPAEDVSLEAMGIFLGIVGYILGARAIGIATILFSSVLMFVVLMMAGG